MKTDHDLNEIAKRICNQGWVNVANAVHLKELRSIQIDALRHARGAVMAAPAQMDEVVNTKQSILNKLDKLIRELELR